MIVFILLWRLSPDALWGDMISNKEVLIISQARCSSISIILVRATEQVKLINIDHFQKRQNNSTFVSISINLIPLFPVLHWPWYTKPKYDTFHAIIGLNMFVPFVDVEEYLKSCVTSRLDTRLLHYHSITTEETNLLLYCKLTWDL